MALSSLWRTAIAVLLFLFCYRLWHMGITAHDDAVWFLAARAGNWGILNDFAVGQGRIWAYISGTLIYIALYFTGQPLGDGIKIGSFVLFFLLFYKVIALYLGERAAVMAAALNLALFSLRWDGSIVTCYPAFFWLLGSVMLCTIFLSRKYMATGNSAYLFSSVGLLFLSLFTQEGASVLLALLFLLAVFGDYYLLQSQGVKGAIHCCFQNQSRKLTVSALVTITAYFILYFFWRDAHPSNYAGNTIGHMSLLRVLPVLFRYSTSGSLLSDMVSPYSVLFSDAVGKDNYRVTYSVFAYILSAFRDSVALLYGLGIFALVMALLNTAQLQKALPAISNRKTWSGIALGGLITVLPILPVALTEKYQRQCDEMGIHSYVYTALSHFGITLSLACILLRCCSFDKKEGKVWPGLYATIIPGCIAILAMGGYAMNNDIANDMRVESSRWKAIDHTMAMTAMMGMEPKDIYAPRLANGSWFTVMKNDEWSQYTSYAYQKNITFWSDSLPAITKGSTNAVYMDYQLGMDSRQMIVFVAPLTRQADHNVVAGSIALSIDRPTPSDYQQYILSFRDKQRGMVSLRFAQMDMLNGSRTVRIVKGISAVPSSIRVERHSVISQLPVACGDAVAPETTIAFGILMPDDKAACDGFSMLQQGWSGRESVGVWTDAKRATLTLPTAQLPPGDLMLSLSADTYVGLGYAEGTQKIALSAGNRMLGERTDRKGDHGKPFRVKVPADAWTPGKPLALLLSVDRTLNPARLKLSADTRDLGVFVYSMEIQPSIK